jgi:hypothetical protein
MAVDAAAEVDPEVQVRAFLPAGVPVLDVDEVVGGGYRHVMDGVIVQRRGFPPFRHWRLLRRHVVLAAWRVIDDAGEYMRVHLEGRAGPEFAPPSETQSVGRARQADDGARGIQAVVAMVPSPVGLETAQVAVNHAAAEGMGNEIHFLDAQVIPDPIDKGPELGDMVPVGVGEIQCGVVLTEVVHRPDLAVLVPDTLQIPPHSFHAPCGMSRMRRIPMNQDHGRLADRACVLGLVLEGIATEPGQVGFEIAREEVHRQLHALRSMATSALGRMSMRCASCVAS